MSPAAVQNHLSQMSGPSNLSASNKLRKQRRTLLLHSLKTARALLRNRQDIVKAKPSDSVVDSGRTREGVEAFQINVCNQLLGNLVKRADDLEENIDQRSCFQCCRRRRLRALQMLNVARMGKVASSMSTIAANKAKQNNAKQVVRTRKLHRLRCF